MESEEESVASENNEAAELKKKVKKSKKKKVDADKPAALDERSAANCDDENQVENNLVPKSISSTTSAKEHNKKVLDHYWPADESHHLMLTFASPNTVLNDPKYHLGLGEFDIIFAKQKEFGAFRQAAEFDEETPWSFKDLGNVHGCRIYHANVEKMLWTVQIIVPEGQGPTFISFVIARQYTFRRYSGRLPRGILLVGTSGSTLSVGTVFCVGKAFNGGAGLITESGELLADITDESSENAKLFQEGWRRKKGLDLVNTFSTASVRENLSTLINTIKSKNLTAVDMESYSYFYCLNRLELDKLNYEVLELYRILLLARKQKNKKIHTKTQWITYSNTQTPTYSIFTRV